MPSLDRVQMESLRRASRRAGFLTALGALIVFGSLAYSAKKLTALDDAVNEKQKEYGELTRSYQDHLAQDKNVQMEIDERTKQRDQLQTQITALNAQLAVAEKSSNVLRREVTASQESLRQIQSEAGSTHNQTLTNIIQQYAPISALAQPFAAAQPAPGQFTADGKQLYNYSLWLSAPDDKRPQIQKVTYTFNHPTFIHKDLISSNSADGFRVGYLGWGCLNSVIITIQLESGKAPQIDFDMCAALERSAHAK